jgi:hypothetical protein
MNEDFLDGLYKAYKLDQKGTFDEFKAEMSNKEIREGFFKAYKLDQKGTFDEFENEYLGEQAPVQEKPVSSQANDYFTNQTKQMNQPTPIGVLAPKEQPNEVVNTPVDATPIDTNAPVQTSPESTGSSKVVDYSLGKEIFAPIVFNKDDNPRDIGMATMPNLKERLDEGRKENFERTNFDIGKEAINKSSNLLNVNLQYLKHRAAAIKGEDIDKSTSFDDYVDDMSKLNTILDGNESKKYTDDQKRQLVLDFDKKWNSVHNDPEIKKLLYSTFEFASKFNDAEQELINETPNYQKYLSENAKIQQKEDDTNYANPLNYAKALENKLTRVVLGSVGEDMSAAAETYLGIGHKQREFFRQLQEKSPSASRFDRNMVEDYANDGEYDYVFGEDNDGNKSFQYVVDPKTGNKVNLILNETQQQFIKDNISDPKNLKDRRVWMSILSQGMDEAYQELPGIALSVASDGIMSGILKGAKAAQLAGDANKIQKGINYLTNLKGGGKKIKNVASAVTEFASGSVEGTAQTRDQAYQMGLRGAEITAWVAAQQAATGIADAINPMEIAWKDNPINIHFKKKAAEYAAGKISKTDLLKETGAGLFWDITKNQGKETFSEAIVEPIVQNIGSDVTDKITGAETSSSRNKINARSVETAFWGSLMASGTFGVASGLRIRKDPLMQGAINYAIKNPEAFKGFYDGLSAGGPENLKRAEFFKQTIEQAKEAKLSENDQAIAAALIFDRQSASLEAEKLSEKYGPAAPLVVAKQKEVGELSKKIADLFDKETSAVEIATADAAPDNGATGAATSKKVFTDFDNTLFDPKTGQLTDLGIEMKDRIANGEDVDILTAREDTPENRKLIADKLGIDPAKIQMGLSPEGKAAAISAHKGEKVFYDDNKDNIAAAKGTGAEVIETGKGEATTTLEDKKADIERRKQEELKDELDKKAKDIPVKKEYYKDTNGNDITVTTYRAGNKTFTFTKSNNVAADNFEDLDLESITPYKTENITSKLENKINAKYDAELKALEQTTTQSESKPALRDVESTAKALETESKNKPTIWEQVKQLVKGAVKKVGDKLGIISNEQHLSNFEKAKQEWDKLSPRDKKLKRADYELDDLEHTEGGYYKVGNSLIDLDLNTNHFKLLLENSKFLNILNKLGVTKIHSENRPAGEMFAHYSDGKIHLNNNSAYETEEQLSYAMSHELGHHEWTKLTKEERDYVRSLPLETGMAKHYEAQEKSGKGKETSASLQEENFADYVMQYFQGKLYGDEALLNKIPTKLRELFDNKYSDLLKDNEHTEASEAYHTAKADGSNPELVKAVESLLSKEQSTSTTQSKIEEKKADIERRRQEELDANSGKSKLLNTPTQDKQEALNKGQKVLDNNKDLVEQLEKEFTNEDETLFNELVEKLEELIKDATKGEGNFTFRNGKVKLTINEVRKGNVINTNYTGSREGQVGEFEIGDIIQISNGSVAIPGTVTKVSSTGRVIEVKDKNGVILVRNGIVLSSNTIQRDKEINAKYDAELAALEESKIDSTTTQPIIEAKKADIERRRKEEILKYLDTTFDNLDIPLKEEREQQQKINAKYDAELKALEQTTTQSESKPALRDVESTAKALEVANKTKVERFYPDDKVILTTKDGKEVEVSFRGYNGENKAVIFGSRGSGINQMEVDVSQLRAKGKSDKLSKEDRKELLSKIDFQDKNAPSYSEDFTDKELQDLSVKYPKESKLTNKEKQERNDLNIATTPLKRWQEQEYGVDDPNDPINIKLAKEHETAISNIITNDKYSNLVSEAYHKAKADGSNPELVKAVESLLSKEQPTSTTQSEIEAKKADIERRRQEELKNRVVYDRFPTVKDGEFKIVGDPNNRIYRINENTGRPQELDPSNGLWSNTALAPNLFMESTKRSGFEKSKDKINAKYDAELAALKQPTQESNVPVSETKIETIKEPAKVSETAKEEVVPTKESNVVEGSVGVGGDVKATAKALEEVAKKKPNASITFINKQGYEQKVNLNDTYEFTQPEEAGLKGETIKGFRNQNNTGIIPFSEVAEAYHKAKADGSNPELVKAVEHSLKETTKSETPTPTQESNVPVSETKGFTEGSVGGDRSDGDIEKRMAELEGAKIGTPELAEFNALEKEMEKRERDTVFNVPLENVNDAVDALMKKEKEQPNGFGSFIEKRDARETKEVADRYLNAKELTDAELKQDFSDAVRGNPTTWYADGLKMREALKEATNRGIDTKDMLAEVVKVYEDAGYDIETAKSVVAGMLKPIFEGSQKVNEKKAVEHSLKETTKSETPTPTQESNVPVSETKGFTEGSVGGDRSDGDIEKRMAELEGAKIGTPELAEFNALEKEMEKRERDTVFNVPLENVNDAVDALMKKEKEQPNGFGSFIEKRDARETKEVADRYLNAKELTDAELKQDFSDAVRGNPTTWYADGLKMREALKEATNRGIDTKDMLAEVVKVYEDAGYDIETAKSVVAGMLKPIFEGSQKVNEKKAVEQSLKEQTKVETVKQEIKKENEAKKAEIEKRRKQDLSANDKLTELSQGNIGGATELAAEINAKYDEELKNLETPNPTEKEAVDGQTKPVSLPAQKEDSPSGTPAPKPEPKPEKAPDQEQKAKVHKENIVKKFSEEFGSKGIPKKQIDAALGLMEARAKSWASEKPGRNADEWYDRIADVKSGEFEKVVKPTEEEKQAVPDLGEKIDPTPKPKSDAKGNPKGAVETLDDGRKVIVAFPGADFSTMVHELAHIFEGDLTDDELKTMQDIGGSEAFAESFETYIYTGEAPTPKLKALFNKFKQWMADIYRSIIGSPIENTLRPDVKQIFDRLLTEAGDKTSKVKVTPKPKPTPVEELPLPPNIKEVPEKAIDQSPVIYVKGHRWFSKKSGTAYEEKTTPIEQKTPTFEEVKVAPKEVKTKTLRKGTRKVNRKIKNKDYQQALSHVIDSAEDLVIKGFIEGAKLHAEALKIFFKGSMKEVNARISLINNELGYKTITALAHALHEDQSVEFTYQKFDDLQIRNAIETVITEHNSVGKMVETINAKYAEKRDNREPDEVQTDEKPAEQPKAKWEDLPPGKEKYDALTQEEKDSGDYNENGEFTRFQKTVSNPNTSESLAEQQHKKKCK